MTSDRWRLEYLDAQHGAVHFTPREEALLWLLAEARWLLDVVTPRYNNNRYPVGARWDLYPWDAPDGRLANE